MNQKGVINLIFSFGIIIVVALFVVFFLQVIAGKRNVAFDRESPRGVVSAWRDERTDSVSLKCEILDESKGLYHCLSSE
jgi:hypothetical protein